MKKEYIDSYEKKLAKLSESEKALRNVYLRKLALGEIQGPGTNYPQFDMPWLKLYEEDKISFTIPEMTVYDYVKKNNQDNLDKTALEYFGTKFTYEEFFNNSSYYE